MNIMEFLYLHTNIFNYNFSGFQDLKPMYSSRESYYLNGS